MTVSIIAAVSENGVIGKDNGLPWYLPADIQYFKLTTLGHHVIMGRKNYLSIPENYRPLPGRANIIVTRQEGFEAPGCKVVHSIDRGLEIARRGGEQEAFIIGGGEIYRQVLEQGLVDKLYITEVKACFEGDVFFPDIDYSKWREVSREERPPDEKNPHPYAFVVYEKRRS